MLVKTSIASCIYSLIPHPIPSPWRRRQYVVQKHRVSSYGVKTTIWKTMSLTKHTCVCVCSIYCKDLLKESLGSVSVDTVITQQYRTLRFSACPPLTWHGNRKEGSRDLRFPQWRHTPATRDVSNSGESCVFPRDPTRGVILKWIQMPSAVHVSSISSQFSVESESYKWSWLVSNRVPRSS
jgi:hypothetical protein